MSRFFNPQKEIEFKPQPLGGAISPVDYTYHIEDIVKAALTMRHGTTKPTDIVDGEFWCKNNADGSFTIFRWRESDGEKDGTDISSYSLSTTGKKDYAPVGILDPVTNKVFFDASWNISNPEISQAIPVDPVQASTEKVASEKAVYQAIANIPEPEKADDYIEDYYPKTDAEKAVAGDNWWRKWKSGFIEQGGLQKVGESYAVSLLVPMSTVNYLVMLTVIGMADGLSAGPIGANNKRNTLFDVTHDGRNLAPVGGITGEWQWEVRGY